jgi:hypothetical protein
VRFAAPIRAKFAPEIGGFQRTDNPSQNYGELFPRREVVQEIGLSIDWVVRSWFSDINDLR